MYEVKMNMQSIVKEPLGDKIVTPQQVYTVFEDMGRLAQESIQVLTLSVKNRQIDRYLISLGTTTQSQVDISAIFRVAILDNAPSIVVVHNHPSGDPCPSAEDIKMTKRLVEAGKIMGITIIDHVIIGRVSNANSKPFYSIKELGLMFE